MKLNHLPQILLFCLLTLCLGTSCEKDAPLTISSVKEAMLEGEIDEIELSMNEQAWKIAQVTALDGKVLYNNNGEPMTLDGLGVLQNTWLTLTRDKENSLTVRMEENLDQAERGIVIYLQMNKNFYKEEVIIRQKAIDEYEFKSINYSIERLEGDGDRKLKQQKYNGMRISNHGKGYTAQYYPYWDTKELHSFRSEDKLAFKWLKGGRAMWVNIPWGVANGEIVLSTEKRMYTNVITSVDSQKKNTGIPIEIQGSKTTTIESMVGYRELQASYTLVIVNARTKEEKAIKGKVSFMYPDGFEHTVKVSELSEKSLQKQE